MISNPIIFSFNQKRDESESILLDIVKHNNLEAAKRFLKSRDLSMINAFRNPLLIQTVKFGTI
jgi:hypothetical protein